MSEALAKKVLGSISSSVSSVASDRKDHLLVPLVVAKQSFESITQGHEVFVLTDSSLQDCRFQFWISVLRKASHGSGSWLSEIWSLSLIRGLDNAREVLLNLFKSGVHCSNRHAASWELNSGPSLR